MKISIEEISVKELEEILEMKKRKEKERTNECELVSNFISCKNTVWNHYLSNINAFVYKRGHNLIYELHCIVERYGYKVNKARWNVTKYDARIEFEFETEITGKRLVATLKYDRVYLRWEGKQHE